MLSTTKKTLLAFTGIAAFAAGGATFAGAAANSASPSPSSSLRRAPDAQLTGQTAEKVKSAAEDKVPGGTVLRAERGGPGGSAYHAHVRKSDGTEVVVLVNSSFRATAVETRPARGTRDHGRRGPGGRHAALTGETAAKVNAAAEAKVPGGTVLRAERGGPDGAAYHAHVRKSDGTEVVVLVNSSFQATSVAEFGRR